MSERAAAADASGLWSRRRRWCRSWCCSRRRGRCGRWCGCWCSRRRSGRRCGRCGRWCGGWCSRRRGRRCRSRCTRRCGSRRRHAGSEERDRHFRLVRIVTLDRESTGDVTYARRQIIDMYARSIAGQDHERCRLVPCVKCEVRTPAEAQTCHRQVGTPHVGEIDEFRLSSPLKKGRFPGSALWTGKIDD
jgi:hypothetical protein